jgi:branched-chain amino acid transport system substrate-binding protein
LPWSPLSDAILDEYAPGVEDPIEGLNTFITIMSAREALEAISGEATPETVEHTIRSASLQPIPGGCGLEFQCNGEAAPLTPAVCIRGTLRVTLDDEGNPVLPYEVVGAEPDGG